MILVSYAQHATNELPYGLRTGVQLQRQDVIVLTAPDRERIEKEDLVNDQLPGQYPEYETNNFNKINFRRITS